MTALPFILVGAGARARALWEVAQRSPKLECVAGVARSGQFLPDWTLPVHTSLNAALEAHPSAAVVSALPPRANLDVGLTVAAANRITLLEAPLHWSLASAELPLGASQVQVDHGWVSLPGRRWLEKVLAAPGRNVRECRLNIDVRGLPAMPGGALIDVLTHALALARHLSPGSVVTSATLVSDAVMEVFLASPRSAAIRLRVHGYGHGLQVEADGPQLRASWRWSNGEESVHLRGSTGSLERTVAAPSAETRALHQLLSPDTAGGDTLVDAAETAKLVRATLDRLPLKPVLGLGAFAHSARLRQSRPDALSDQLGLIGPLPEAAPAPVEQPQLPSEPTELWPFRAGIKPVAFLTLRPEDVDSVQALFSAAHVERRDRRVLVGVQDTWVDRRDAGEPRAELYISNDAALAVEAAHVQAETDPTKSLRRMGELMGYPECCVDAFAKQDDRANNSRNRYSSFARTPASASWPWELNNLFGMVVPFYPCHFTCPNALDWARRVLAEMDAAHPGTLERVRRHLARPVLYFDHDHQVSLDATEVAGWWSVSAVAVPPKTSDAFARFAGSLAGTRLRWLDDRLELERDGARAIIRRTDPGLGFFAPFQ